MKGLTHTSVLRALRRNGWVIADAAQALGVSKQGLYKAMRRYVIKRQPQPDLGEKRRRAAFARWRGAE